MAFTLCTISLCMVYDGSHFIVHKEIQFLNKATFLIKKDKTMDMNK